MFTLDDFESHIPPQIRTRGLAYFNDRAVTSLEESATNHWEAVVFGSEEYEVEIALKGKQITHWQCDCPYEGSVCKHVVAVLYALRETKPANAKKREKTKTDKLGFEDMLMLLHVEELRAFIRDQKANNRDFGNQFMLYFAHKDPSMDLEKKYREMVRQLAKKHSDRGFMDYRNTRAFARAMEPILQASNQALARNNFREALAIAKVVAVETMDTIKHCDDSSGSLSYVLSTSIEYLGNIAQSTAVAPELLHEVFNWLEKQLADQTWFDYGDFGYELLDVTAAFAARTNPDQYLRLLEQLLASKGDANYHNQYLKQAFTKRKILFLQSIGREQEVAQIIADNMDIVEVRQHQVEKAIQQKNYRLAKQLVAEGILIAQDKKHAGTVHQWEEVLLQIAKLENDIPTFRFFAKRFAFDRGMHSKYYQIWKSSFSAAEWPEVIEQHIQTVFTEEQTKPRQYAWEDMASSLFNKLAPIYIAEQLWERLLNVLPAHPGEYSLAQVHPYLAKRYPAEMLAFYLNLLEKMGDQASDRKAYQHLAALMRKVKQDIESSHTAIDELAASLIQKYPRRPAMKEELGMLLRGK